MGYRGELVVGEINCRHGPDIIGRHLSSKEASFDSKEVVVMTRFASHLTVDCASFDARIVCAKRG